MEITENVYGKMPDGRRVLSFCLRNDKGMYVEVLNYGGIVRSLFVPDREGKLTDVVLGYENFEDYMQDTDHYGAIIGRNVNRIANGLIEIFGKIYHVEKNKGNFNMHGGSKGLSFRLFDAEIHTVNNLPSLVLNHIIEDMSDGFPGKLDVKVTYTLTNENALMFHYCAVSDADTIINLTNHSYFNLAGHDSGSVGKHIFDLHAGFYTPNSPENCPYGEILSVEGTPLDFRGGKELGKEWDDNHEQIKISGGYAHNVVLSGAGYRKVAAVTEPVTGRVMEVFTDRPGLQLYSGNAINENRIYKKNARYQRRAGFCMETQFFPNAVNLPWFPSPIFHAGEEFKSSTAYIFSMLPIS